MVILLVRCYQVPVLPRSAATYISLTDASPLKTTHQLYICVSCPLLHLILVEVNLFGGKIVVAGKGFLDIFTIWAQEPLEGIITIYRHNHRWCQVILSFQLGMRCQRRFGTTYLVKAAGARVFDSPIGGIPVHYFFYPSFTMSKNL